MDAPQFESVLIQPTDQVTSVVIDAREERKGINGSMIHELIAAFAWIADRGEMRAVIITGDDQDFCLGYDTTWLAEELAQSGGEIVAQVQLGIAHLNQLFIELRRIPVPVVAAIEGRAVGPGLSLALACDARVVAEDTVLRFGFGDLGIPPHAGLTFFLPRIVQPARALELLLENQDMNASEALSEGLVQQVAPPGHSAATAAELAMRLAKVDDPGKLKSALEGAPFDSSDRFG